MGSAVREFSKAEASASPTAASESPTVRFLEAGEVNVPRAINIYAQFREYLATFCHQYSRGLHITFVVVYSGRGGHWCDEGRHACTHNLDYHFSW